MCGVSPVYPSNNAFPAEHVQWCSGLARSISSVDHGTTAGANNRASRKLTKHGYFPSKKFPNSSSSDWPEVPPASPGRIVLECCRDAVRFCREQLPPVLMSLSVHGNESQPVTFRLYIRCDSSYVPFSYISTSGKVSSKHSSSSARVRNRVMAPHARTSLQ